MDVTIRMDAAGRIVLPKRVRELLRLRSGARLRANVVADKIELTPEPDDNVRIVRKGRRLVITGLPDKIDALAAIKAERDRRDNQIAERARH